MNNSDMSSSDMDDPKTTASKVSQADSGGLNPEREAGGASQDLGVVYGEMRSALLRFASRYFKKPQEIEDVVQEAFVKVIEAQHRRDIHSPKSYLFRTTRNLALTQLEKSSYKLTDTVGDLLPETDLTSTGTLEDQFESRQNFELFCR
ncbi:MAG: RNA polymerase sigma factor, partial [Pseudomonadales bacterium]